LHFWPEGEVTQKNVNQELKLGMTATRKKRGGRDERSATEGNNTEGIKERLIVNSLLRALK
jgi:hypothetical protein